MLAACWLLDSGAAQAQAAVQFEVDNDTSGHMINIYVSPSDDADWGSDVLGPEVVEPDGAVIVYIQPFWQGCLMDMKATFSDRPPIEIHEIDICSAGGSTIMISDD